MRANAAHRLTSRARLERRQHEVSDSTVAAIRSGGRHAEPPPALRIEASARRRPGVSLGRPPRSRCRSRSLLVLIALRWYSRRRGRRFAQFGFGFLTSSEWDAGRREVRRGAGDLRDARLVGSSRSIIATPLAAWRRDLPLRVRADVAAAAGRRSSSICSPPFRASSTDCGASSSCSRCCAST